MSDDDVSDIDLDLDNEVDPELNDFDPVLDATPAEEADGPAPRDDDPDSAAGTDSDEGEAGPGDGSPRKEAAPPPPGGVRTIYVVAPEDRQTSERLSVYERTRAIAIRAEQLTKNPTAFVPIGNMTTSIEIATAEFDQRMSPLIVQRIVGRTPAGELIVEEWTPREMVHPGK